MSLTKSQKNDLLKITDLCCCVNAYDGYCGDYPISEKAVKNPRKVEQRRRKVLTDTILDNAWTLWLEGVPLTRLSKALVAGGWDDNYFDIDDEGNIKIEYKV